MNKEYFLIMNFPCYEYIVKYKCNKNYVSKGEIEDCIVSYYDSTAFDENKSYQDIIHDIMTSFEGVEYELVDNNYIDIPYLTEEYEKLELE